MEFEWDERKAAINERKHGISFRRAVNVFDDVNRIEFYDEVHSINEERWVTIGRAGRILFVVYTEREYGNKIRIISARLATAEERRMYYAGDLDNGRSS